MESEETPGELTVDLLDRIQMTAQSMKNLIIANRVKKEDMHSSVHNSVCQILQIIRNEMNEQDFNSALATKQVQAPYQSSDIEATKRSLT